MTVRRLTDADLAAHDKVAGLAYILDMETELSTELPCENVVGTFDENGLLMADAEFGVRECFFGGEKINCAAIGGVASRPECRNRGAVRAIFDAFFRGEIFPDGFFDVAILYPFSHAYYGKFGFTGAGLCERVEAPFTALRSIPAASARLWEGGQEEKLIALYNACAQRYPLSFVRRDVVSFSPKPLRDKVYTYIYSENGTDKALVTFAPDRAGKTIFVRELFYLDKAGLFGILGFLGNYAGNYEKLVFEKLPASSPVISLLPDKEKLFRKTAFCGQVKVMNAARILSLRKWGIENGSFTLGITDSVPALSGTFSVSISGGRACVKRSGAPADITLDSAAATSLLLCGVRDEEELEFLAGAEVAANAPLLAKAFCPSEPFYCDGF